MATATSVRVACTRCAWTAITSNPDIPPNDPQSYDAFVRSPGAEPTAAAARLAVTLGRRARDLMAVARGDEPFAAGIRAVEVLRLAHLLAPAGFGVRTEPVFPWPFPAVEPPG